MFFIEFVSVGFVLFVKLMCFDVKRGCFISNLLLGFCRWVVLLSFLLFSWFSCDGSVVPSMFVILRWGSLLFWCGIAH